MAIAFNSYTTTLSSGSDTVTDTHTFGSGSGRLAIVGVSMRDSTAIAVSTLTIDGTSITANHIGTVDAEGGSTRVIALYYMVAPPSGAKNVVLTADQSATDLRLFVADYTGVYQADPIDASNTDQTETGVTEFNPAITVVTDNSWIVGLLRNNTDNYASVGANTTSRTSLPLNPILVDSNAAQASGSRAFSATVGSSANHVAVMVSIAPAPAPAVTMDATVGEFILTGVNTTLNKTLTMAASVTAYVLTGVNIVLTFLNMPPVWTSKSKSSSSWSSKDINSTSWSSKTKSSTDWTHKEESWTDNN